MDNSFLHRKKLLLVDDEPLVLIGMQGMLNWAALGYEVVGTARNGAEALRAVQEKQPDIVVSDIRMPVMDGFALAEKDLELRGSGDFLGTRQSGHFLTDIKHLRYSAQIIFTAKKLTDEAFERRLDFEEIRKAAMQKYESLKDVVMN